jgi:hypothetical protein
MFAAARSCRTYWHTLSPPHPPSLYPLISVPKEAEIGEYKCILFSTKRTQVSTQQIQHLTMMGTFGDDRKATSGSGENSDGHSDGHA